jgi:hypothetical protein
LAGERTEAGGTLGEGTDERNDGRPRVGNPVPPPSARVLARLGDMDESRSCDCDEYAGGC